MRFVPVYVWVKKIPHMRCLSVCLSGANDWEARQADIVKMRMMGAKVIKVSEGLKNLKAAADKYAECFFTGHHL